MPPGVGAEPGADVAAAGHGRQIVHPLQQVDVFQSLENTETEGGTADAATGKCQANEVVPGGCDRVADVPPFDVVDLALKGLVPYWRGIVVSARRCRRLSSRTAVTGDRRGRLRRSVRPRKWLVRHHVA